MQPNKSNHRRESTIYSRGTILLNPNFDPPLLCTLSPVFSRRKKSMSKGMLSKPRRRLTSTMKENEKIMMFTAETDWISPKFHLL